jgi:hypothetical protein
MKNVVFVSFDAVQFGESTTFRANISPPFTGSNSESSNKPSEAFLPPESGSHMILRNVGLSPN